MYDRPYAQEAALPHLAKVFRSGNSQAIRLPGDFRLDASKGEISR